MLQLTKVLSTFEMPNHRTEWQNIWSAKMGVYFTLILMEEYVSTFDATKPNWQAGV
jgi:hypothetical protein